MSEGKKKALPLMQGLLPIKKDQIYTEVIAGITLAALAIPEVMGYTKIAGMPVITGLYTMLIPMVLFAFLGSSRHLVVGADSATAAIMAAGLLGLATVGSDEYIALAGALAIMAGVFLFLARIIGLGFMADFLSRTVLIGFMSGVGIQVAAGQLGGMLGIQNSKGDILSIFRSLDQVNLYELGLALGVLLVIVIGRFISKKIPGALIAVIAAIILSWAFDFGRYVDLVGSIPGGLPVIALPDASWSLDLVITLIPTAFAMFIVILTQSAATSRSYASKYNEVFSEDRDLSGLAMANFGAALSGTFVVNGSPTKTQMVDGAGGRTQLSQLVTVVIVLVVLLFLTGALAYLPESVLYAVVFVIGLQLIDLKGMRKIYTERRSEFWVALSTAIMVIVIGVEEGIIFAIFLSLIEHTRHGYHPKNTLVTKAGREAFKTMPVSSHAQILPGLVVYRFVHSLYYANSALFSEEVSDLVNNATNPVKWFCLDASAIDDIDFTASETLYSTCELLKEKGVRVVFSQLNKDLKEAHKKPLEQIIDEDIFYHTNFDVVKAYEQKYGTEPQKSA